MRLWWQNYRFAFLPIRIPTDSHSNKHQRQKQGTVMLTIGNIWG